MNFGATGAADITQNALNMATTFNAPTAFGCSRTGRSCQSVKDMMAHQQQQQALKQQRA